MYRDELEKKLHDLDELIKRVKKLSKNPPNGWLRVSKSRNKARYYHVTEHGDNQGRYIKEDELDLAVRLTYKDYYEELISEAERQQKLIQGFLDAYDPDELGRIYDSLCQGRKDLISNLVLTDKEYVRKWQEEKYDNNLNYKDDLKYETKRGEYVRSKSEKMIADIYYEMGIPYRYEYPLHFDNGVIRYPDFTLLKMPERKIIYHEHLGLLDSEEYVNNNIVKIMEYEREGIYEGVSLILTGESSEFPFSEINIRNKIAEIFL